MFGQNPIDSNDVNNRPGIGRRFLLSRPLFFAKVFETEFNMGSFFSKKIFEVGSYLFTVLYLHVVILIWKFLSLLSKFIMFSDFLFLIMEHNMIVLTKIKNWRTLLNYQNYTVRILPLMLIANKMMLTKTNLCRRAISFHFPLFYF